MAVKDDTGERPAHQATDKTVAVPLRESPCAAVEHQIAGRDYRDPIDHRFRQVGPRFGFRNGYAVIVLAIGDERPSIILAFLDEVQLVTAPRTMLNLPQFPAGRKRQAIGRAVAAGP